MSVKLIAMGNMLMMDDGIGITIAKELEEKLTRIGIDVIYGEKELGFGIASVKKNDLVLVLDSSCYGIEPGMITEIPLVEFQTSSRGFSHHSFHLCYLLNVYYPKINGYIYGIEEHHLRFGYGLCDEIEYKKSLISSELYKKIVHRIAARDKESLI